MHVTSTGELDPQARALLAEALEAWRNGFNPYSHFLAGAALRTRTGEIVRGANMFISSTGLSQCAEVTALTTANTLGLRAVESMAVVSGRPEGPHEAPHSSCGRCRQVLHEFSQLSGRDIPLWFANPAGDSVVVTSIQELLPAAYTSGALKSFSSSNPPLDASK